MARSTKIIDADYYNQPGDFGYYQRTNLQTMIDNFMIGYIGTGKVLGMVPRHEVAFWMQRAIQEFSYDIFHSEKRLEFELGPTLSVVLPSDYVNYVEVNRTTTDGRELKLIPNPRTRATQGVVQDENYEPVTDQQSGEIVITDGETLKRFGDNTQISQQISRDYYYENYDGDFSDNYYTYYGRRFGLTPSDATTNGTFIVDNSKGILHFDAISQQDDIVTLTYISDGIGANNDLEDVYVPKLAEDAVYYFALSRLTELRTDTIQVAPLYKKQAKAKMQNAKIRLMNLRPEEMANTFRNKSKWIKH